VWRLHYALMYLLGQAPWDTNITPPEIVALVETEGLRAGRALDLGCGTGTNVIYLARHGWQVTGIDFVGGAIRQARRKARKAGVSEQVNFLTDSVARLGQLGLPTVDLAMDIGCLSNPARAASARSD
jgi:2-polyprenyl-3-methyl-5-hydroxy-6-metoxy-1,4-benzoquinol methylase